MFYAIYQLLYNGIIPTLPRLINQMFFAMLDNTKNNFDDIKLLIDSLKASAPEAASKLECFVENVQTEQDKTKKRIEECESIINQLALINNSKGLCTILLEKSSAVDTHLLSLKIKKINLATIDLLNAEYGNCEGRPLSDFIKIGYNITLPANIDETFNDVYDIEPENINKQLVFDVCGLANGDVFCYINDVTEVNTLRNQLNTHLQRFELITEALVIANSTKNENEVYSQILQRIGFHLKPKRVAIFIDTNDRLKSHLKNEWTATDIEPLHLNSCIEYNEVEPWRQMLLERKMILGFNTKNMPTNIANLLTQWGLNNAYIFPIVINSNDICGSLIFESCDDAMLDNFEISYIKIIATLISGHITNKLISDDIIIEKERAQKADSLKSSFLVNMSHDIRIPLNSIIGFSDLLADEDLTQTDREEFISIINRSSQDLISLIDNIIDLSKIETGQMSINNDTCNIENVLNDILTTYKKHPKLEDYEGLSLQLDYNVQYSELKLKTDVIRFKQICNNLIDNALKFSENGVIRFGVNRAWGRTIEFYVQDMGIGIPEEEQQIIFQDFSKVDRTFAKMYNGAGLGLSICKKLVNLLGGDISVVSVLGKGSTFYFTLPLCEDVPPYLSASTNHKSLFNWANKRVAIINNNKNDLELFDFALNETKIDIIQLKDSEEAIQYFGEGNNVDLVIVDTEENSIDSIIKIYSATNTPILIQSPNAVPDENNDISNNDITFIYKPLNVSKLLIAIDNILTKKN